MTPATDYFAKGASVEEWTDVHFFRPVGLRITRLIAHTRISPDQVTVVALITGLVAGRLLFYDSVQLNALGVLMFIVSDIFDSVDGQLARMRGTSTRFGRIVDGGSDGLRFLNMYCQLGARLIVGGEPAWYVVPLVLAAGFAHVYQSTTVDFIKQLYLHIADNGHGELDLPEDVDEIPAVGWFSRFHIWLYRPYVARYARVLPTSVRVVRRMRAGETPADFGSRWARCRTPGGAPDGVDCPEHPLRTPRRDRDSRRAGGVPLDHAGADDEHPRVAGLHARAARRGPARGDVPQARRGRVVTLRRGVLVGAGGVARLAHLPAYHEERVAGRLSIVAAVDSMMPPPDLGGLPVRPNLRALVDDAPIHFVDICTPTVTHRSLVLEALALGLHVFCEKPVAVSAAEARELAQAARRTGRVLFPCHQYRENPAWKALRQWIDDGAIGRWHLAEFSVYRPEADRGSAAGGVPWRGREECLARRRAARSRDASALSAARHRRHAGVA